MNYQTFEPSDELKDIVKCYWTLEGEKEAIPQRQTIVPDGCIEMIFHFGDLYKQYTCDGNSIIQPRCFVFGQLTEPLEIEPTGTTGIFSVRFHPGGFFPFASMPIREMEQRAVPLADLFGEDAAFLETSIIQSTSVIERITAVEIFLLERLQKGDTIDKVVTSTVETILTGNGQLQIDELSRQLGINRRQMERRFAQAIGMSPKQLSKTVRLQSTLKMLLSGHFTSLTSLAYEGEYYDQSHFIKDFKELTGFTPKDFYGDNLKMSALFVSQK